jgi:hypothetical protein
MLSYYFYRTPGEEIAFKQRVFWSGDFTEACDYYTEKEGEMSELFKRELHMSLGDHVKDFWYKTREYFGAEVGDSPMEVRRQKMEEELSLIWNFDESAQSAAFLKEPSACEKVFQLL